VTEWEVRDFKKVERKKKIKERKKIQIIIFYFSKTFIFLKKITKITCADSRPHFGLCRRSSKAVSTPAYANGEVSTITVGPLSACHSEYLPSP
jgi:hypothetical protein